MTTTAGRVDVSEEDRLRADLYDFLSALLASPPDAEVIAKAGALAGDNSPLGRNVSELASAARAATETAVSREFHALFIGLGRGELLPYASYYLTGFLNEKPLAALRRDMAALGFERAPNVFEPEDNMASLCEIMAGMIRGRFGDPAPLERQRTFFNKHIGPWAGHFFKDLEGARSARFYAPVGAVGRAFMDIEKEAFRMAAEAV